MSSNEVDPTFLTDRYGYGRGPSLAMCTVFVIFFSLSTLAHLTQLLIARRQWYMAVMLCGGIMEILGWAGRLAGHSDAGAEDPYVMQLVCLVIAPTFYSAAVYGAGGLILQEVAARRLRISPKWFKITFVVVDVVSLLIQAAGGGIAGMAEGNVHQVEQGSHVMLAGIIAQLVVMVVFLAYLIVWGLFSRSELSKAGGRMQLMYFALVLTSIAIIFRGGFRTAELNQGWRGKLATTEKDILFDAIPVLLATLILNFVHPHWFLPLSSSSARSSSDNPALPSSVHDEKHPQRK